MIEIKGNFNTAKVFTNNIEETALEQITTMCNQDFFSDSKIRIMPDTHAGAGCVIGTTMTITDKLVPNLVGVDIGCGMHTTSLGNDIIDLQKLDTFIHEQIPCGFNNNVKAQMDFTDELDTLRCMRDLKKNAKDFNLAIGSLGSGNHFIELNVDSSGGKYLVIHSGSRNLGHQVATYYQDKAFEYHSGLDNTYEITRLTLIKTLKDLDKKSEIKKALSELKKAYMKESPIEKSLCYLEGQLMQDYLHDMNIVQLYANYNREIMTNRILTECLGRCVEPKNSFQTIHNYIDLSSMILRKGAISAQQGELVLIPINMRDGSLLCRGKGNPDWNFSAPHGAGRLMSRTQAKEQVKLADFEDSMKGIYTTSVNASTLDESAFAYKPMQEIIDNVQDSVDILDIIKPIYNFKAN